MVTKEEPKMRTRPTTLFACLALMSGPALAQSSLTACESQQSLEQSLQSDGGIRPDDCRPISVARLSSEGRELCLIDLSQPDSGIIASLRDVAAPDQWWVLCSDLVDVGVTLP
jgi:hypothetical protein